MLESYGAKIPASVASFYAEYTRLNPATIAKYSLENVLDIILSYRMFCIYAGFTNDAYMVETDQNKLELWLNPGDSLQDDTVLTYIGIHDAAKHFTGYVIKHPATKKELATRLSVMTNLIKVKLGEQYLSLSPHLLIIMTLQYHPKCFIWIKDTARPGVLIARLGEKYAVEFLSTESRVVRWKIKYRLIEGVHDMQQSLRGQYLQTEVVLSRNATLSYVKPVIHSSSSLNLGGYQITETQKLTFSGLTNSTVIQLAQSIEVDNVPGVTQAMAGYLPVDYFAQELLGIALTRNHCKNK